MPNLPSTVLRPIFCVPAILLLASALSPAQVIVEADDQLATVRRITLRMARDASGDIWDDVQKLVALGDGAIDPLEELYSTASPLSQVGILTALCLLEEVESGVDRALELVADPEAPLEARLLAARAIYTFGGRSGSSRFRSRVDQRLQDCLDDLEHTPLALKVALSEALFQAVGNPRGRKELIYLLDSDDPAIRNRAALALGEIGDFTNMKVKDVLRSLRDEPGPRGRLARTYLELESFQAALEDLQSGVDPASRLRDPPPEHPAPDDRYALLAELEERIRKSHTDGQTPKADHKRLLAHAAKGMVESMDPHSTWWTGDEYNEFMEDLNRDYGGIGAYVGFRGDPQVFTILRPIYSGPAYKVGLRSWDVIVSVDGWDTFRQKSDDIIKRLKGVPGTKVTVTIRRPGWDKDRDFEITRRRIEVASVQGTLLPGNIGYVLLSSFSDDTPRELQRLLQGWRRAGKLDGIILDLRNNGGGYLDTAREVADMFLPKDELIVYSEGPDPAQGPHQELYSRHPEMFPDIPLVVLVNGASASASEIVTGALKVHERAVVVGERTFGKGSVQKPLRVETDPGGRLRLTVARYFLPDGTSIHRMTDEDGATIKGQEGGILPDLVVEPDPLSWADSEQLQRLNEQGAFRDYLTPLVENNLPEARQLVLHGERNGDHWPDFDAWYAGLHTEAAPKAIRRYLRVKLQEMVQDQDGAEIIPITPIDWDRQLQAAIVTVLQKAGRDPASVPEYNAYASLLQDLETRGR